MKQIHQMTDVTLYSRLVKALVLTRFLLTKQLEQAQCAMAWSLPAPSIRSPLSHNQYTRTTQHTSVFYSYMTFSKTIAVFKLLNMAFTMDASH